jgi:hypothetical protein
VTAVAALVVFGGEARVLVVVSAFRLWVACFFVVPSEAGFFAFAMI